MRILGWGSSHPGDSLGAERLGRQAASRLADTAAQVRPLRPGAALGNHGQTFAGRGLSRGREANGNPSLPEDGSLAADRQQALTRAIQGRLAQAGQNINKVQLRIAINRISKISY